MARKVSFHTLGCRLNISETGSIAQGFAQRGYEIVPFDERADIVFLNTCTVTDGADKTCRQLIRKALKNSPESKIIVAGCYAQMEAQKIKDMPEVDLILGTQDKFKVFDYLDKEVLSPIHISKSMDFHGAFTTPEDSHTRAFLKIQDGCNYICSFCIIPFARGRSRVITISEAREQARKIVNSGYKEIILTGVNIGEYEATGGERLVDLVQEIVSLEGVKRLRLSSVEPNTITRELLEILKESGKYQNHFHIPLQSADDLILKSMRRKYDIAQYKETIAMIFDYFPNASLGADIITGYPGESEEQFLNTFHYLKESQHTHFHVFPYSVRKGTTAQRLPEHLDSKLKKDRVRQLINLGQDKLNKYAQGQIGQVLEVLFERVNESGYYQGYSGNYLKVFCLDSSSLSSNQIRKVKIISYNPDQESLIGELI